MVNDSGDDRTGGYDPDGSPPDAEGLESSDSSDERDWSDSEAEELPRPDPTGDTGEFVDLPAWATDATRAADHVESSGFDGDPEMGPYPERLDLDPDSYEREQETLFEVAAEADEEQTPDVGSGEPPFDLEEDEAFPGRGEAADPDMPHGVATARAYDALAVDDGDDLDEWAEFAGAPAAPSAPRVERMDVPSAEQELSRKERRRARKEARSAEKEAGRRRGRRDDEPPQPQADDWVEADPDETAWLREGVHEEEPPTPGTSVFAPPMAGDDEVPPRPLPPSNRPEEPVWLASEQPLVGDGRSPDPSATESDDEIGDEDEWVDASEDDDRPVRRSPLPERPAAVEPDDEMGGEDEWFDTSGDGDGDAQPPVVIIDDEADLDLDPTIYTTSATREHRGLAEAIYRAGEEDLEWQAMSASMPGLGTGVIGYEDVADLGDDEQEAYVERTRSDLGTRVFTGIVLLGLLLGSMWVGREAFAVFIGVMVFIALTEYYTALRRARFRPIALFGYLGGLGVLFGVWFHGALALPVVVCLVAVVTYFVYAFAPLGRDALTNGGLTLLGVVWVTGTASLAFPIVKAPGFHAFIITVVVATAAMDIGAYGFGRVMGSRRLAPLVSPNKSVEGLIGGIICTFAAAAGMSFVFEEISLSHALALAAVVSVLAPLGDLAESMFKRSMGIKDMGAILPGHGGILDRIDAFLFVVPGAWVLFTVQGLVG